MGYFKKYTVSLQGLQEGHVRRMNYQVDDEFLSHFPEGRHKKANLDVQLAVVKTSDFIILEFKLKGTVNVQCDLCLDYFDKPVEITRQVFLTTNPDTEDEEKDVVLIGIDENEVNIAQYIYEFIHLGVPIKNQHPGDADGNSACNPEMLRIIKEHKQKRKEQEIDPRWAKLKELKDKNN